MKQHLSSVMTLLLVVMCLQSVHAQTETVITQCDYQHVSKAIETGGSITLDCDHNIQIWSNKPLTITADTIIRPAEGRTVSFEALKGRAFVINKDSSLTISDMTLKGNANQRGGGIENNGGKLLISNVVFDRNDSNPGAAIHNFEGGNVTIENSSFSDNQSPGGNGGAIYNDANAEITIHNTSFTNNKSQSNGGDGGGAIYNLGKMSIDSSIFNRNIADNLWVWGGAILNSGSAVLDVLNSTFVNNKAYHSGGAIRNDTQAETTIEFSTFINNSTDVWGGALYIEGGTLTVSNSLFSGNTADKKANDCSNELEVGTLTTLNNLSNSGCGDKAASGVATLSNNGGLTQTVAIASNSNAVDAANGCPSDAVDGRGVARPQGEGCDIGAYEFMPLSAAATSIGICQITTTRNIRLRQEPNTAGSVLAVVPHNSTFQAIEQITGWYHITYGSLSGWISAEFVTAKGSCGS